MDIIEVAQAARMLDRTLKCAGVHIALAFCRGCGTFHTPFGNFWPGEVLRAMESEAGIEALERRILRAKIEANRN